jgi:hypothetical protein
VVPNEYRTQDGFAGYSFSIEFQSDVGWCTSSLTSCTSDRGHDDTN